MAFLDWLFGFSHAGVTAGAERWCGWVGDLRAVARVEELGELWPHFVPPSLSLHRCWCVSLLTSVMLARQLKLKPGPLQHSPAHTALLLFPTWSFSPNNSSSAQAVDSLAQTVAFSWLAFILQWSSNWVGFIWLCLFWLQMWQWGQCGRTAGDRLRVSCWLRDAALSVSLWLDHLPTHWLCRDAVASVCYIIRVIGISVVSIRMR